MNIQLVESLKQVIQALSSEERQWLHSQLAQEMAFADSKEDETAERNGVQVGDSPDPIAALIGTLNLGTTDLSENHDHYLTKILEEELDSFE
jgi:hypothetical protein